MSDSAFCNIDHMTITIPDFGQIKHFSAICPVTKYAVCQADKEASSKKCSKFS